MNLLTLGVRGRELKPSPTLGISARAAAMKAQGIDVISLAAGEPDFPTPAAVSEAAIEAIRSGFTKYTATPGIAELREAVADKFRRENGFKASAEGVVISSGAKQSIYNALNVLLDPGDEVILLAPYWMTYAEQVRLAGGVPVIVRCEASGCFVPEYDGIREAITSRTKAIIVNSPSNPTGAVLPRETIKQIAALALRYGFWIISDEIYEKLVYGEKHVSFASLGTEVADQTITVTGCSKSYAMTGWRIGFACAPVPVAKAMSNLQDQVTSNANSIAQKAAITALQLDDSVVEGMRAEYQGRRDLVVRLLQQISNLEVPIPQGAFYVFPGVNSYLSSSCTTDEDLANHLLENAKVATVPGSVFAGPGHIRLSYAASRENITRGVERIAEALERIAP